MNIFELVNEYLDLIDDSHTLLERNIQISKLMEKLIVNKNELLNQEYLALIIKNKLIEFSYNPPLYPIESKWKGAEYYYYNIFDKPLNKPHIKSINLNWKIEISHSFIPILDTPFYKTKELLSVINSFNDNTNNPKKVKEIEKFLLNISSSLHLSPSLFIREDAHPWLSTEFSKKGLLLVNIDHSSNSNINLHETLQIFNHKLIDTYKLISKNANNRKISSMDYGNGYIISKNDDTMMDSILKYNGNIDQYQITLESSGHYEFMIKLPTKKENLQQSKLLHIKAIYLLQLLEPLIIAVYSSCDIRSVGDNEKYVEGSYSIVSNMYNSYDATSEDDLLDRDYDLNDIESKIRNSKKISNISQFKLVYNDTSQNSIKGIKFKLWDNFNPKYLEHFLKIILLISTNNCKIDNIKELNKQSFWIDTIIGCLINGWNTNINNNYLDLVYNKFCINTEYYHKEINAFDLLNKIISHLYMQNLIDKDNLYWIMVNEKKIKENKPIVVNVNKLSWEFALKNSKKKEIIDKILKFFSNSNDYTSNQIVKIINNTNWNNDVEEILEFLVKQKKLIKRYANRKIYYRKI